MAFHDSDPLFGSLGLCPSDYRIMMQFTNREEEEPETNYRGNSRNERQQQECNELEPVRYQYQMLESDVEQWRIRQDDKHEEERHGEKDCLICSYGDPHGTTEHYQQVLDYYNDNKNILDRDALHRGACEKYREKVYDRQRKRRGSNCDLPLLEPRHFRRHEERCDPNPHKMAEQIATKLFQRLEYKFSKGVRRDTQTGIEEIDTPDTHRAIQDFLKCAHFSASAPSTSTTINVSSTKRGTNTKVSVSTLVGLQKEKRQKRLDSLTLSKYS